MAAGNLVALLQKNRQLESMSATWKEYDQGIIAAVTGLQLYQVTNESTRSPRMKDLLKDEAIGYSYVCVKKRLSDHLSTPVLREATPSACTYVTAAFIKYREYLDNLMTSKKIVIMYGKTGTGKTSFAELYASHHASNEDVYQSVVYGNFSHGNSNFNTARLSDFESIFRAMVPIGGASTLYIIDQFDLSNIKVIEAFTQRCVLCPIDNVAFLLIGSSYSIPNENFPERINYINNAKKYNQRILEFLVVKFQLTEAESNILLNDPVDPELVQKSTFAWLFTGSKDFQRGINTELEAAREDFLKQLNTVTYPFAEHMLGFHGQNLPVTKCITQAGKLAETNTPARLIIENAFIVPAQRKWQELLEGKEAVVLYSTNHNVEFFLEAEDGELLCSLMTTSNIVRSKLVENTKKYASSSGVEKGNLFESLFFLEVQHLSSQLLYPQGYKVEYHPLSKYFNMFKAGTPKDEYQPVLVPHPCNECVITQMDEALVQRECLECKTKSECHTRCYSSNVNRHKINFEGWDYMHISEKHEKGVHEVMCIQLFQITLNKRGHNTNTMAKTYGTLMSEINKAKMKNTDVLMYWVVPDFDVVMPGHITVAGESIKIETIVKIPSHIDFT